MCFSFEVWNAMRLVFSASLIEFKSIFFFPLKNGQSVIIPKFLWPLYQDKKLNTISCSERFTPTRHLIQGFALILCDSNTDELLKNDSKAVISIEMRKHDKASVSLKACLVNRMTQACEDSYWFQLSRHFVKKERKK